VSIVNTNTLIEFELKRGLARYIPYKEEVSIVDEAKVHLRSLRIFPNNYRFDITLLGPVDPTDEWKLTHLGDGTFAIGGDHADASQPYRTMLIDHRGRLLIKDGSKLLVTSFNFTEFNDPGKLTIGGRALVAPGGYLHIDRKASVEVINGGHLVVDGNVQLDPNGDLLIGRRGNIFVGKGARFWYNGGTIKLLGTVWLDVSKISHFMDSTFLTVDPQAIARVRDKIEDLRGEPPIHAPVGGFTQLVYEEKHERWYSLCDYANDLRLIIKQPGSSGSHSLCPTCPVPIASFKWVAGQPEHDTQVLDISLDKGEMPLGDFWFNCFGLPDKANSAFGARPETITYRGGKSDLRYNQLWFQFVRNVTIQEGATLVVDTMFKRHPYYRPSLYLGLLDDFPGEPGSLNIRGKLVVSDPQIPISFDKGATITIEEAGEIHLLNESGITNGDGTGKLIINGKLYLDDLSQLREPPPGSIEFGPKGKVIVLNPSPPGKLDRRLIFSFPNGLKASELYRLFGDRLEHVEFHLQRNTGIAIDADYDPPTWSDWYNNMRLEKAIHEGLIVWHDGAYLEANLEVLPWLRMGSEVWNGCQLFQSGARDLRKLTQDMVDRFTFAGSGDVVFRFTGYGEVHEATMRVGACRVLNAGYYPLTDQYGVLASGDGEVFMNNGATSMRPHDLINDRSQVTTIDRRTTRTTFTLP
jgi:hypothetical protein